MKKLDKILLKNLCKNGNSFDYIKILVNCSDATIKRYMKIFSKKKITGRKACETCKHEGSMECFDWPMCQLTYNMWQPKKEKK